MTRWRGAACVTTGVSTGLLLLLLSVAGSASSVAAQETQAPPVLPHVKENSCPFECCTLGRWTTTKPTTMYQKEADLTSPSFVVPAQAEILVDSANLHTISYGVVLIEKAADISLRMEHDGPSMVEPGEIVLVLGHEPESGMWVWMRGQRYLAFDFWDTPLGRSLGYAREPGLLLQPLHEEWWVRASYEGRTGWFDAFDTQVWGSDACGD